MSRSDPGLVNFCAGVQMRRSTRQCAASVADQSFHGGVMPSRVLHREWLPHLAAEHASKWATATIYLAAYIVLAWASTFHVHKGVPVTPFV